MNAYYLIDHLLCASPARQEKVREQQKGLEGREREYYGGWGEREVGKKDRE